MTAQVTRLKVDSIRQVTVQLAGWRYRSSMHFVERVDAVAGWPCAQSTAAAAAAGIMKLQFLHPDASQALFSMNCSAAGKSRGSSAAAGPLDLPSQPKAYATALLLTIQQEYRLPAAAKYSRSMRRSKPQHASVDFADGIDYLAAGCSTGIQPYESQDRFPALTTLGFAVKTESHTLELHALAQVERQRAWIGRGDNRALPVRARAGRRVAAGFGRTPLPWVRLLTKKWVSWKCSPLSMLRAQPTRLPSSASATQSSAAVFFQVQIEIVLALHHAGDIVFVTGMNNARFQHVIPDAVAKHAVNRLPVAGFESAIVQCHGGMAVAVEPLQVTDDHGRNRITQAVAAGCGGPGFAQQALAAQRHGRVQFAIE